ncbi:hypothetical protein G195_008334 [Phytophthora kernoviae 00238/432]|nr:hypothetical protein G195_008334 [Phytophthora kernoviae 00238/432]
MVMACTSELDKKGWMDAFKFAIDVSKTVNRMQNPGESLREAKALCTHRTESLSVDGSATFLDHNAGDRLSQFNYEAFSTPVVHVAVLSATNLTKSGSSVNAFCEVTVGAKTFKTSMVKNQRSPVWKQDNTASFEAPSEDMVVEIRIFDEHLFRATELITMLTIPLKSLINMQKATKEYPVAFGSRSAGAVLTLSLEYVNKLKAQVAKDEATYYAARAQEEARMLFEQYQQKTEAAMAEAREEQRKGKAAVERAMAKAAQAKEEAETQLAEARRAREEAQKLIEANRRIQAMDDQCPSTGGEKQMEYTLEQLCVEYMCNQKEDRHSRLWRALLDVTHGLQFLHSKDIVHSDLKGDNILLEGDKAMLTDFGMSFFRSENRPRFDNVGAIRWRAPEFIMQGPSFEADVYSLGMCIVEAMTGKPPWGLLPDVSVTWHLNNGKFLIQPKCMSDVEWSLIRGMCAFDPAQRMALDEVESIVKEFAENEEDNERMGSYV